MLRRICATLVISFLCYVCTAQQRDSLAVDTSFVDYDELFSELDALLDSLLEPKSMVMVNLSLGERFMNYESKATGSTNTQKRINYSPSVGYFHRSGFGLSAGASLVNDNQGITPYQYSLSGSFDFQKDRSFIGGVSFTHFFTKKDLLFYTSPLQNEIYGYFTYRKFWLRPSIGLSYGWGKREDIKEVEERIQNINLMRRGFTRINTNEKIIDLNLVASVRHDFYFLKLLSSDYVRLTPQLSFVSGSQQFGFNQTSSTYATIRRTGRNFLFNSEQQSFDDQFYFQPISLTTFLKAEYAKGKFYIQPQLLLDYYFPTATQHFSTAFLMNIGLIL